MLMPISDEERLEMLEDAIEIAAEKMGKDFFKEETGHFWSVVTTRPYMRAKQTLVDLLIRARRKRNAIEHCNDMLNLNPNDNQGMREVLLGLLLEIHDIEAAGKLIKKYSKDSMAVFRLGRVLYNFLNGNLKKAEAEYQKAHENNSHIKDLLTGKKKPTSKDWQYYTIGSKEEAAFCYGILKNAWRNHPRAIEWLKCVES